MISRIVGALVEPTPVAVEADADSLAIERNMAVEQAVKALEATQGIPDPTSSSLIEGRWQLVFTTRPGTASPIQRTFVGVDLFSVFQEIYLQTNDQRVSNIVKFSDAIGELKVEAAATVKDGKRILFRFDKAAFELKFLPFKVPYPVPFRLLGDEAKGWLDTTYLSESGNLRISRGNKGTTFLAEGEWQMIWSSQMETDSWIENAANGLMGSQIVKDDGRIKFLVDIVLGFKFSMNGTFEKSGSNVYDVTMDDGAILIGPYGIPVELVKKFKLEVLYSDDKIRVTRGYSNIIFVHLRV
nr:probable plastid-lipid-associated protein 12, chloroplastic [Tanacetum cinerariifolium]